MNIPKYINNIESGSSPCNSVLGDDHAVATVGGFYDQSSHLLQMIRLHCLVGKINSEIDKYNSEQFEAYCKGIDDFIDFFITCNAENQKKTLQES